MTRLLAGLAAATGLFATSVLLAQQPPPAVCQINGRISGAGVPLPGVALVIADPGGTQAAARATTASGVDGAFRVTLPTGSYEMRAELTGFDPVTRPIVVAAPPAPSAAGLAQAEASATADCTQT